MSQLVIFPNVAIFKGDKGERGDSYFLGVLSSEPISAINGNTYINSTNNGYFIYYNTKWFLLSTLIQENIIFDGENVTYDGEQVKG